MEEEAILGEIERSRPMFFDGGGVTFTGGEPTLQFEALARLLEALKARGVHTALETNGTHPQLPALFPLIDFLILDVKHYDAARHARVIGGGQPQIRRNLTGGPCAAGTVGGAHPPDRRLQRRGEGRRWLCRPLPGSGRRGGLSFAQKATLELLRYHEYGKDKWAQCGREYAMTEAAFVTDEQLAAFERVIRAAGSPSYIRKANKRIQNRHLPPFKKGGILVMSVSSIDTLCTPETITGMAKALFKEERAKKRLDGWFLAQGDRLSKGERFRVPARRAPRR